MYYIAIITEFSVDWLLYSDQFKNNQFKSAQIAHEKASDQFGLTCDNTTSGVEQMKFWCTDEESLDWYYWTNRCGVSSLSWIFCLITGIYR